MKIWNQKKKIIAKFFFPRYQGKIFSSQNINFCFSWESKYFFVFYMRKNFFRWREIFIWWTKYSYSTQIKKVQIIRVLGEILMENVSVLSEQVFPRWWVFSVLNWSWAENNFWKLKKKKSESSASRKAEIERYFDQRFLRFEKRETLIVSKKYKL